MLTLSLTNRVYNLIFLIITYILGGIFLSLLGLSFVGIALILIYAGAILVFFLFIVLLLGGRKFEKFKPRYFTLLFLIVIFSFIFFSLNFNEINNIYMEEASKTDFLNNHVEVNAEENTEVLKLNLDLIDKKIIDNLNKIMDENIELLDINEEYTEEGPQLAVSTIYIIDPIAVILCGVYLFAITVGTIKILSTNKFKVQRQISIEQIIKNLVKIKEQENIKETKELNNTEEIRKIDVGGGEDAKEKKNEEI